MRSQTSLVYKFSNLVQVQQQTTLGLGICRARANKSSKINTSFTILYSLLMTLYWSIFLIDMCFSFL